MVEASGTASNSCWLHKISFTATAARASGQRKAYAAKAHAQGGKAIVYARIFLAEQVGHCRGHHRGLA